MQALTRARRRHALALTVSFSALALGATACGSSGDNDADPAQAVPSSAPIYAQVTIKPDGDLRSDTEAVLKKFGVADPAADITKLLKDSQDTPTDAADADKIVQAAGSRAGVFVSSFTGDVDAALVLSTTDPDGMRDVLETSAKRDGDRQTSYNDVDYWVSSDDGTASGIVGDYTVAGTERAFRTVVDTVKGDDVETIADNADYQAGLDAVSSDGALATAYISTEGVLSALGRSGGIPAAQLGQIREQLAQVGGKTSVVALSPGQNSVAIDVATLGLKEGAPSGDGASAALAALPGDAWLGVGLPHIGESLRTAMQQSLQLASMSGQDVSGQIQAAEQALGLDIEDDLLSWMGDGGVFARGTTVTDIGGALVIKTTDAAKAKQTLSKLATLVPQLADGVRARKLSGVAGADEGVEFHIDESPFPIVAAVGGDTFVLGVGAKTVEQALSPSSTLADSASYKAAASALGNVKPAFFVDVAAVSALLKGVAPTGDPSVQQVVTALDKVATVAAGTSRDGSTQHAKFVVSLK